MKGGSTMYNIFKNRGFSIHNEQKYDTKEIAKYRRMLLENVNGEILEIGTGIGLNLPYYPSDVRHLTGIDEQIKKIDSKHIEVDYYYGKTNPLPFAANSFDTIVATFALSRMMELSPTIEEIKRVLRSRGRFLLLDHGRTDNKNEYIVQDIITPFSEIIGGRVYNRDYFEILENHGFLLAHAQKSRIHMLPKMCKGTLYSCVAVNIK